MTESHGDHDLNSVTMGQSHVIDHFSTRCHGLTSWPPLELGQRRENQALQMLSAVQCSSTQGIPRGGGRGRKPPSGIHGGSSGLDLYHGGHLPGAHAIEGSLELSPGCELPVEEGASGAVIVFYCCLTKYHKLSGIKHHSTST